MSCGCGSNLWGGLCCAGPGQQGSGTGGNATSLAFNVDLSSLNIYNAYKYTFSASNTGAGNVQALNTAATAAYALGGGELWIPNTGAGSVNVAGTISLSSGSPNFINVKGTSNAQTLTQSLNVDTFFTANGPGGNNANVGGVSFADLNVSYFNGATAGAAFDIQSRNAYLERIVIQDAPVGVYFQNNLSGVLRDSDILYRHNLGTTGIIVGSQAVGRSHQSRVERCQVEFLNPGLSNSIGLQVVSSDHFTADDNYFYGCNVGVAVTPPATGAGNSVQQTRFYAMQIGAAQFGFQIQPQSGTGPKIQDLGVYGGQVQGGSNATGTSMGFFIDCNTGTNAQVDGIIIVGVNVESWGAYGYNITSGQNIQIIGGRSNSNGLGAMIFNGTGPTNLVCTGFDMSAVYQNGTAQPNSLVVDTTTGTGSATFVNCPMLGYSAGISHVLITAIAAGFVLRINGCPGYNDQKTAIVPASSMPTSVTSAALKKYYGPSIFTPGASATSYTKNGITFPITAVNFPIPLDAYDTIFQTGSANGTWVGY